MINRNLHRRFAYVTAASAVFLCVSSANADDPLSSKGLQPDFAYARRAGLVVTSELMPSDGIQESGDGNVNPWPKPSSFLVGTLAVFTILGGRQLLSRD